MFYVLEVPNGPAYFQEHCYTEIVDVYDKICMTQIPETCSQLQSAYLFKHIGTFETQKKAEAFIADYKYKRDNPVPNVISNKEEEISIPKTRNKWYGNGDVHVA